MRPSTPGTGNLRTARRLLARKHTMEGAVAMLVMVVDDEEGWRELLKETLEELGHRVLCYEEGTTALRAVDRERADGLVLDVAMSPRGEDILKESRRRWPDLPVVMVSTDGRCQDDPGLRCADGFVRKTLDASEMGRRLDAVLTGALRRSLALENSSRQPSGRRLVWGECLIFNPSGCAPISNSGLLTRMRSLGKLGCVPSEERFCEERCGRYDHRNRSHGPRDRSPPGEAVRP
jgi:CheY-like chemotaxis protein